IPLPWNDDAFWRRLLGDSDRGEGGSPATWLGYQRQTRLLAHGHGRAAPNTHADSGGPAPRRTAAAPGTAPRPVPIRVRSRLRGHSKGDGLSAASGRVQLGTAHGRGGSSGVSSFGGRCGGGRADLGWCFGTKPVITETPSRCSRLSPGPPPRRGP